jgi:hypothetical protein
MQLIFLHHLRWPIAGALGLLAVNAIEPLGRSAQALVGRPGLWQPMALGVLGYGSMLWLAGRSRHGRSTISLLMTLEHELAHTLTAAMLGLRVQRIMATDDDGGHVLTSGDSWLVLLAPYVLPLALLIPALVLAATSSSPAWALVLLGACTAFHAHSSWLETHRHQTDLKSAGWSLSLCIITSGHVLVALWICGLALGHQRHLISAVRNVWLFITGLLLK